MADYRTGTVDVETLTSMAKEARETAARGLHMLELAEEIEDSIDRLAAAAGCTVEDVHRPLWEGTA
jgi:hypothetical protein